MIGREQPAVQDQLREFLTLAMRPSLLRRICFPNKKRKIVVHLYVPSICIKRLGISRFYLWLCSFRLITGLWLPDENMKEAYHRKVRRIRYAWPIVRKCRYGIRFGKKVTLMDLFTHANQRKSVAIGKRLEPHQIIPLEMCMIAQIAHRENIQLLSFNEDYRYFVDFGKKSNYISFKDFGNFLKEDLPSIIHI